MPVMLLDDRAGLAVLPQLWGATVVRRPQVAPPNSAQEATSEDRGLRRQLRSRLSAPNRWADVVLKG